MYEMTLVLKGLNCPNCAGKIERDVRKMSDIKEISLNFSNQELHIKYENIPKHSLLDKINMITAVYERSITVTEKFSDDTSCECPRCATGFEASNTLTQAKAMTAMERLKERFSFVEKHKFAIRFICSGILVASGYLTDGGASLCFFILAYLVLGADVLYRSVCNIFKGDFLDENFLMSAATIGAFILGQHLEAIAVMFFFQIGGYFEEKAVDKSRRSIEESMNIKPEYVNLLSSTDGIYSFTSDYIRKSPSEINVGDVILIKPGEKVPLDGEILSGDSQLDVSSLTGESVPMAVAAGDNILSGSINVSGTLILRAMKNYDNSTVSKILELIENASSKKARTEKFITRFSKIYTPCVVFSALALGIIPPLYSLFTGSGAAFSTWIPRALIFLVTSCPCALVVSIPLTFYSGIGACSRKGVLVKGSNYLQLLGELDTVVFDKTGTLTKGSFDVTEIVPQPGIGRDELLELAYVLETSSNHPVAKSIVVEYMNSSSKKDAASYDVSQFTEKGGLGLSAVVNGETVLVGNERLMNANKIAFNEALDNSTVLYIAKNGRYLGRISVSDMIKNTSPSAISTLKKSMNVIMLTGDRDETAKKIASELGIEKYYSQLLPNQKVEMIEKIYAEGANKIAFTGDGINDAPVLARADVGIAMGGIGSDAAIEAADVVIMNDDPLKIVDAIETSKNTMKLVKQNIIFALGVKFVVLGLAACGLGTLWMAVFADVGVELLVILNSIRKK